MGNYNKNSKNSKYEKWTSEEGLEEIKKMLRKGYEFRHIADEIGITSRDFYLWRRKNEQLRDIVIRKGYEEVCYKEKPEQLTREKKYNFYIGDLEVKWCKKCSSFVDIKNIIASGYCSDCSKYISSKRYSEIKDTKEFKEYNQRYYNENKEKIYTHVYKRYTKMKGNVFVYSEVIWSETLISFDNSCAYCGDVDNKLEKEHVIPVSKNGAFVKSNIIPACKTCNLNKRDKDLEEWYPGYKHFTEERYERIREWIGIKDNVQQLTLL